MPPRARRARHVDLATDLSGPVTDTCGRHPLPEPAVLAARLGALGITADNQVVGCDTADGRLQPADRLARQWRAVLGRHTVDRPVAYCGSGVTACHHLPALAHAGMPGARLYAGSWGEWCRDPARPVARRGSGNAEIRVFSTAC
ncbi:MAG: hypothetical protein Kow0073_16290 [Immundisolibacter sp.]